jgi:hypothetical protein
LENICKREFTNKLRETGKTRRNETHNGDERYYETLKIISRKPLHAQYLHGKKNTLPS